MKHSTLCAAGLLVIDALANQAGAATSCAELASMKLPDTTVTAAEEVTTG